MYMYITLESREYRLRWRLLVCFVIREFVDAIHMIQKYQASSLEFHTISIRIEQQNMQLDLLD